MHRELLEWLACPECTGEFRLESSEEGSDGEVVSGSLICISCGASYPIAGGIPRFVKDDGADFENFGYQWARWGHVQIDRFAGHRLSEKRLLGDTEWPAESFRDQVILDGGCGAGRFADVAAGLGAVVIAVDISRAVDTCRTNLAIHGRRVHCIQASLFQLPIRPGALDAAFSLGVIQHTPDPERAVRSLASVVKPKGRLAVNFYERDFWPCVQPIKYALRLFTPNMRPDALLCMCKGLVTALFPLTRWLSTIPKVRILNVAMPICTVHDPALSREQQYVWTLLDTFDWYGPKFERRQNHRRLQALLGELGMTSIRSRSGVVQAIRPADDMD